MVHVELEKGCGLRFDRTSITLVLLSVIVCNGVALSPIAPLVWLLRGLHVCVSTETLWASQVTYCSG